MTTSKSADDPVVWTAAEMGRKGGKARVPKGFAMATPEQRREWGRNGGKAKKAASATTPGETPAKLE